jgi:uncharacterized protein (TIGR02646 family)
MRKINLTPPTSQTWKRWINDCEKTSKTLAEAVQKGEKPSFNEGLYKRKSIKTSFFFSKEDPFYGKCAYCETYIADFQRGDIEHFRPKAAVANEIDEPIQHSGYYWLAYDWQNLLPSCTICNQPTSVGGKKIGKHNRFPVIGQHAQAPNEVDAEHPLLINPASPKDDDDPSKHLAIDIDTGLMIPLTERGRMCIEIFGLNQRDQLIEERKRAVDQAILLIQQLEKGNDSTTLEKIKAIQQGKRSYTMASLSVFKKAIGGG